MANRRQFVCVKGHLVRFQDQTSEQNCPYCKRNRTARITRAAIKAQKVTVSTKE